MGPRPRANVVLSEWGRGLGRMLPSPVNYVGMGSRPRANVAKSRELGRNGAAASGWREPSRQVPRIRLEKGPNRRGRGQLLAI
jgi:hypothetical protein